MKNLLNFEFRKLSRSKVFYLLAALIVVILIISAVTLKIMDVIMTDGLDFSEEQIQAIGISQMSGLEYMIQGVMNSSMSYLLAVVVAIITCADATGGTLKNIVAKGYKREHIAFTKWITCLFVGLIYVLVTWISAFIIGTVTWEMGDNDLLTILPLLPVQILGSFAMVSVYFAFSMLLKKTGVAIAVNLIGPNLALSLVFTLGDLIVDYFVKKDIAFKLSDLWIEGAMTNVSHPVLGAEGVKQVLLSVLVFAVYFVAGAVAGVYLSRKREC